MLLACLAVGLISCRDTIDPREAKPPAQVQQQQASGPVTVLRLTCTLSFPDGQKGDVRCSESGAGKKGVSQSVILPWYSAYAVWLPFNLVKDTTTETWTFIASVKNLLGQPIGTLDGTTAVGTKVFITYGPVASQGSGDVWITNADGTGNFTAPDQPYFNYPWIVQPQATSPYREWKTHVPNTVTEVTMGVAISTDFPATQNVAASPPDTTPAWFRHDTSWVDDGRPPDGFLKNIVSVIFQKGTSLADRQLAVALVNGKLVGGLRWPSGDGYYDLFIEDDGTGTQLREAITKLRALPQVRIATLENRSSPAYLKPRDGQGWDAWSLSPDAARSGQNWALEAINAPFAWGCSTGDAGTPVGIVDHAFDSTEVASNVVSGSNLFGMDAAAPIRHGGEVSAIVAARGNNKTGITGVMWRAGLMLADPGSLNLMPREVIPSVVALGVAGARVVNLSWEVRWKNGLPSPSSPQDGAVADSIFLYQILPTLQDARDHLPLIVIAAGNQDIPEYFSAYPMIRDSFPAVVVGASTSDRHRWVESSTRGSNFGDHVDLYAPGAEVYTLSRLSGQTAVIADSGTSFAAPYVTGVAGLLASFDPSITIDSMRSYIIHGATNGGRTVAEPGSSTKPLLNAYEALKLAAERPGAPLCGNHVWLVGNADHDTVVVQRGAGATEKIWSDPEGALAILNVKHGGHRISYSGPTEDGAIVYNPLTRQWQMESSGDSLPPAIDGGTFNSFWWSSHSGDSSVVVNHAVQRSPTVEVNLFDSHTLTSKPLATVPTAILNSFDSTCVGRKIADNSCSSMTWTGEQQEAYLLAAYSPIGDSAIISVSRIGTVRTLIPEWFPCGSQDSTGTYDHECRNVSQAERSIDTKFYTIPTSTVTSNPSVSWTMAGDRVTQLVITYFGAVTASPLRRSPITLNYRE